MVLLTKTVMTDKKGVCIMGLLGALESINARLEDNGEGSEGSEVDEVMVAVMEADQEIAEETDELMELDEVVEETEVAVERLEGIRDAIMTYGISKSMMYAADPKCELSEAGIVASYEELEDVPVKDENADAAVEGIGETIKNIWTKLVAIFQKVAATLRRWFDTVMRGFKSYESALAGMIGKVKKAKVKDDEFGKLEVSAVSKTDFDTLVKATKSLVGSGALTAIRNASGVTAKLDSAVTTTSVSASDIDDLVKEGLKGVKTAITQDVTDATGIYVERDTILRKKAKIERKKATIDSHGWSTGDVVGALTTALGLVNDSKKLDADVSKITKGLNDAAKLLKSQTRKIDNIDSSEVKRQHRAINGQKKVLGGARQVAQSGIVSVANVAKIALAIGKAALKSAK